MQNSMSIRKVRVESLYSFLSPFQPSDQPRMRGKSFGEPNNEIMWKQYDNGQGLEIFLFEDEDKQRPVNLNGADVYLSFQGGDYIPGDVIPGGEGQVAIFFNEEHVDQAETRLFDVKVIFPDKRQETYPEGDYGVFVVLSSERVRPG